MKKVFKRIFYAILKLIPYIRIIAYTKGTQTPIKFKHFLWQKIFGFNRRAYWPCHFTSIVSHPKNIYCGIETCPGYSPGNYIQAIGKIIIGDYTQIGPNVGIISSNHNVYDNSRHIVSNVVIGKYCWIGMGAIIMPGVKLGDFTIVGAGAIVTKSFEEGYCVIAGNPAKKIKALEPSKCIMNTSEFEFNGFIPSHKFEKYRKAKLNV